MLAGIAVANDAMCVVGGLIVELKRVIDNGHGIKHAQRG